jgi:hypothetical protein
VLTSLLMTTTQPSGGTIGATLVVYALVAIAVIAGMWKVFDKADQPGWAAIVPIYNFYVLTKVVGRPGWWVVLTLVPLVNLVVAAIIYNDLAKSFGEGVGYTIGLLFLPFVFFPMLGFGDAAYQGPSAA